MRRRGLLGLCLLPLVATTCDEAEVEYEQINGTDLLSIEVGVDDLLDSVSTELSSNTGAVVVGSATADPGGGPAGTTHTVSVVVDADYADQVDLVRVIARADGREAVEFSLSQDAFDESIWVLEIESFATDGEIRTDTLAVELLDVVGDTDPGAEGSGDTGD
ncbi:MAG TPA: hypothetical protein QGF58_05550 [Myxococcota bacterium]|nr:hypothetical protein [Myxococcota bacterium]